MEQKLNIAKILKNKPRGTKLYSMIHGECSFEAVTDEIFKINFCTSKFGLTQSGECTLIKFGNMYDGGECIIFPSKEMRDWSKLAWNTGDILVNKDGNAHVIFEGFDDDTYETFNGNNYLWENEGITMCFGEYEDELPTSDFSKANKEDAQKYIRQIEKRLGYKLNFETLKIEKSEFKDGDVVVTDTIPSMCYSKCIFILKGDLYTKDSKAHSYVFYNISNNHISFDVVDTLIRDREIRLATNPEKLQLFDILTKEGKYWDAANKQIVDLKEYQFKPFEKVLVRDSYDDVWRASFFSHIKENDGRYVTTCVTWKFCIPYEGNEHLLGTTKDSK